MVQDTSPIKEKIVSFLMRKGPSLPVHISKEIGSNIIFASAFLSELVSEKRVKISYMRVGSSPIYFLSGQESSLERFSQYLKSKEREAFLLLKEKRFLIDSEQLPAIRVALRAIRDFALPFKVGEEIIWRYSLAPESEFIPVKEKPIIEIKQEVPQKTIEIIEETKPIIIEEIEKKQIKKVKKEHPKTITTKKKSTKKDDKFFGNIKEFLSQNSIELLDIENFGKKEIVLKVKDNGETKLLIAYNKNKIVENDIIQASKKASELGLTYIILGLGGPLKKLDNLIEALKGLSSIKKVK